jgi:uncharacterized integral membrane protein
MENLNNSEMLINSSSIICNFFNKNIFKAKIKFEKQKYFYFFIQIIFTLIFLFLALYIDFNKNNLNYLSENFAYNLFVIAIYLAVMFGTMSLTFMMMFYTDISYGKKKKLSISNYS